MKPTTGIAIAFVLGAAVGGLGFIAWDAKNDRAPVTSREQDSLAIDAKAKALFAQWKMDSADTIGAFADTIEAHMLPPETLYIRNHETALTADTSRMWIHMGQLPRDTSITR